MSTTDDLVALRQVAGGRVYAMGAVPANPTYPYLVIGYAPAAPVVRDLAGGGDPERRFTVQHFDRTIHGVEDHAARSFSTFDGREVDGNVCWQETATPAYRDADDNGVLSIVHTYRY